MKVTRETTENQKAQGTLAKSHQPSGRRWSRELPLPTPHLPLRGRVYPSPYPLPWGLDARAASDQSVQDGPRWRRDGQREAKMASKMARDRPRWLKMASCMPPRGFPDGPREPQDVPREPQQASKTALSCPRPPKRVPSSPRKLPRRPTGRLGGAPEEAKISDVASVFYVFGISAISEVDASKTAQDGPRRPQDGPKTAPRRPKMAPRSPNSAQDGPKIFPRWLQDASR